LVEMRAQMFPQSLMVKRVQMLDQKLVEKRDQMLVVMKAQSQRLVTKRAQR